MFVIRPIQADEWAAYRGIRLRALQDSPNAFGSTFEAEATRSDDQWASRLRLLEVSGRDHAMFAEASNGPCGLAWCKISAENPILANLYQMWVAPEMRGRGVGRALLSECLTWAASTGVRRVQLGVTASDSPAWRLYTSQGFRPVGALEPLREGSPVKAQTMECSLGNA
jgi:ribosomal protein S18 acetylase RimI-like enzyme